MEMFCVGKMRGLANGRKMMKNYVIGRFLQMVPMLLCITFLAFAAMWLAGDDAVDLMYEKSGGVTEEVKAAKRAELGLDQPFLVQYGVWLKGAVTGDMGKSYISGKPVWETFMKKLPATLYLMLASVLMTLAFAVPLGILAAARQNRWVDVLIRIGTFVGNSLPNFFVGLLLIYVFAVRLEWLPILAKAGDGRAVLLPALTLAIAMGAKYTRQIRAVVLEELAKPYVVGARARGVKERTILVKSVLRSSLVLIVTLLALSMGSLLGGTAIVETIFLWDGVGKMAVEAVLARDYPLVQAYVAWMAVIYVVLNLAADIFYRLLDPRVGYEKAGAL